MISMAVFRVPVAFSGMRPRFLLCCKTWVSSGIMSFSFGYQVQKPLSTGDESLIIQRRNIWMRLLAEFFPFATILDFGNIWEIIWSRKISGSVLILC